MSTFDPNAFMNASITEANDTQYVPFPEGEYSASIDKVEPKVVGQENPRPILNVTWKSSDPDVQTATGRAENSVRQTIWLDVTESGGLDFGKGKNVQLGKLRDALNQNRPGQAWAPGMLVGGMAKVKVKHSIDRRDGVTINAEVAGVTKL
jgi:hypothetical protein